MEEQEIDTEEPSSQSLMGHRADEPESSEESGPRSQPTPPEILENLPQDQRRQIEQFFGSAMSVTMGAGDPIADKITSQHITDAIALSGREVDLEYEDRRHSRLVIAIAIGFILIVLTGFGAYLAHIKSNALLMELIKIGVALAGGLAAGME